MGRTAKNRDASTQSSLQGLMVRKPKSMAECARIMDVVNEYIEENDVNIKYAIFKGKRTNYRLKPVNKRPDKIFKPRNV